MKLSLKLAAAVLALSVGSGFCANQSGTALLGVIQSMSYDFNDVGHPGGVLFTLASMPNNISRFILRENDLALDRNLSILLKAKEMGRAVSCVYNVDPLNASNGLVTSVWFN